MPIIVVARLRLRDPSLLDEFFTHAVAVLEQAQKMDGNLGADALAEAHDVWWDVTAWQSRAQIEVFLNTEPHLSRGKLCRLGTGQCHAPRLADQLASPGSRRPIGPAHRPIRRNETRASLLQSSHPPA